MTKSCLNGPPPLVNEIVIFIAVSSTNIESSKKPIKNKNEALIKLNIPNI